jgi:hypothetical protein
MLVVAHFVELYVLAKAFFPFLNTIFPDLPYDVNMLQPTLFSISCAHVVADDSAAQKSIAEGGIGYRGVRTSLEGICTEVKAWNDEHKDAYPQKRVDAQFGTELKNIATVPAATGA